MLTGEDLQVRLGTEFAELQEDGYSKGEEDEAGVDEEEERGEAAMFSESDSAADRGLNRWRPTTIRNWNHC